MFIRSHMAGRDNSDHPQGFDEGLWAISRSNHIFALVRIDQTHEQFYKWVKIVMLCCFIIVNWPLSIYNMISDCQIKIGLNCLSETRVVEPCRRIAMGQIWHSLSFYRKSQLSAWRLECEMLHYSLEKWDFYHALSKLACPTVSQK